MPPFNFSGYVRGELSRADYEDWLSKIILKSRAKKEAESLGDCPRVFFRIVDKHYTHIYTTVCM